VGYWGGKEFFWKFPGGKGSPLFGGLKGLSKGAPIKDPLVERETVSPIFGKGSNFPLLRQMWGPHQEIYGVYAFSWGPKKTLCEKKGVAQALRVKRILDPLL